MLFRDLQIPRLRFATLGMTGFTSFRSSTNYEFNKSVEKFNYHLMSGNHHVLFRCNDIFDFAAVDVIFNIFNGNIPDIHPTIE